MYVLRSGVSSQMTEVSVLPCTQYVSFTLVSARVYLRNRGVHDTANSVYPLSLHCTKQHFYKTHIAMLAFSEAAVSQVAVTFTSHASLPIVQ
jgi:hypothetical protein